ncbi:MAG: hypothetical protein Q7T62_06460 [Undibacterium sp.]|nr:hypothetical protein [Undibacterium sp.]
MNHSAHSEIQTRPMYSLFTQLLVACSGSPNPPAKASQAIHDLPDCAALTNVDDTTLTNIALCANTLQRTLHLGTSAIGSCLALAAPDAVDGEQCGPATVEAIGWLVAELGDLSAISHHIEATANRLLLSRDPYRVSGKIAKASKVVKQSRK